MSKQINPHFEHFVLNVWSKTKRKKLVQFYLKNVINRDTY